MKKHKRRQLEIKKQKKAELKYKEQELKNQTLALQQQQARFRQKQNNVAPENVQKGRGCITITPGCLLFVLLTIAICIGVKECKRSNLRLEYERKLQKLYDSVQQQQMMDTTTLTLEKQK